MKDLNKEAPMGVNNGFQSSWVWPRVEVELAVVRGTIYSLVLAVTIVGVALLIFTGNLRLTAFITFAVLMNILSLLGATVLLGWDLGMVHDALSCNCDKYI